MKKIILALAFCVLPSAFCLGADAAETARATSYANNNRGYQGLANAYLTNQRNTYYMVSQPDVDSAVIQLTPRAAPPAPAQDEAAVYRVIRAAFGQRRKTLANALSAGLALPKDTVIARLLGEAGVPSGARAEQLSLADFAKIADSLAKLGKI